MALQLTVDVPLCHVPDNDAGVQPTGDQVPAIGAEIDFADACRMNIRQLHDVAPARSVGEPDLASTGGPGHQVFRRAVSNKFDIGLREALKLVEDLAVFGIPDLEDTGPFPTPGHKADTGNPFAIWREGQAVNPVRMIYLADLLQPAAFVDAKQHCVAVLATAHEFRAVGAVFADQGFPAVPNPQVLVQP